MPPEKSQGPGSGAWINLPVKLFLTDLGYQNMKDKSRIEKTLDPTGNLLPSLNGEKLLASTLKNLIIQSRVNQILLERNELLSKRSEIIDITKLIVYSLLYRLYPINLLENLEKRSIEIRPENQKEDAEWLEKNREKQRALKLELFAQTRDLQAQERLSSEKDPVYRKKAIASITVKLIEMIPIRIWRELDGKHPRRDEIIASAVFLLGEYLNRSRGSDYLAAAFLEWVQNAEKINFKHAFTIWSEEYKKAQGHESHYTTVDQALLEETSFRETLAELARQNRISLKIHWKFGRSYLQSDAGQNDSPFIRISLTNQGLIGDLLKKAISTKVGTSTKQKSLGDFWQAPQDDKQLGSGLGLFYTAYLRSEYQKLGLDVFVQTSEEEKNEETTMTYTIRINPVFAS